MASIDREIEKEIDKKVTLFLEQYDLPVAFTRLFGLYVLIDIMTGDLYVCAQTIQEAKYKVTGFIAGYETAYERM